MHIRKMTRDEIARLWEIDRSEVIDAIYIHEDGELVRHDAHFDVKGWPPHEAEETLPMMLDCFDRGGTFYGAFDGETLAGAAILESRFIGAAQDQLQLLFLHVSRDYRQQGLGRALFDRAVTRARELGARRLYISATPSQNTIGFYQNLGCVVTGEVDPELFAAEPEDIHMEYKIRNRSDL